MKKIVSDCTGTADKEFDISMIDLKDNYLIVIVVSLSLL